MKNFFKIVILFLIVFNFRIPGLYNSVFVAIVLVSIYYIFIRRSIPLTYFPLRYNAVILIGTACMIFLAYIIPFLHESYLENVIFKRFCIILLMLIALVYALPLLIENKRHAFEETIVLLCYTFALQGFIHLCGYIFEPVGELIMTIHGPEFQAFINDPERNIDIFRGYALCGSIFFELPATYGLVCILFFRLQLEENQTYLTGYKSFVVILLIMTGIMLSGRTGFIGFFCGLAYYLFYLFEKKKALMNTIWKLGVVFTLLLLLFYLIFPAKIQQSLIEDVFPFAFEFYYNYEETGSLSTSSTDDLQKNHWFYIEDDILLKGEGLPSAYDSSRHGGSDAGYVNSIVFGGILWLICLIIYQALYFISPLTVAGGVRSKSTKQDAFCFLVLFLYLFILHYKAPTIGTIHSVETVLFFMGASYLIKYYTTENLES